MPVFKNGDVYTYIPPTAEPCPLCGVSVMREYGTLDAIAYENGTVLHHHCEVKVEPLNERQWRELQQQAAEVPPPPAPLNQRRRPPAQRLDETWLL